MKCSLEVHLSKLVDSRLPLAVLKHVVRADRRLNNVVFSPDALMRANQPSLRAIGSGTPSHMQVR